AQTFTDARLAFAFGAATASAVWLSVLGLGSRLLAPLFTRPGAWRLLDAGVACVMLALALALSIREI
ncbi:MAG: lysine transporter LysE, partial [Comamonadaceae bacterium]